MIPRQFGKNSALTGPELETEYRQQVTQEQHRTERRHHFFRVDEDWAPLQRGRDRTGNAPALGRRTGSKNESPMRFGVERNSLPFRFRAYRVGERYRTGSVDANGSARPLRISVREGKAERRRNHH